MRRLACRGISWRSPPPTSASGCARSLARPGAAAPPAGRYCGRAQPDTGAAWPQPLGRRSADPRSGPAAGRAVARADLSWKWRAGFCGSPVGCSAGSIERFGFILANYSAGGLAADAPGGNGRARKHLFLARLTSARAQSPTWCLAAHMPVFQGNFMPVVVVESPAKAKTINKYLGSDYVVLASYGHVRDLPAKDGSVDTEHGFRHAVGSGRGQQKAHSRHHRGAENRRHADPCNRP